jgi:hypothetical protein
MGPAAGSNQWPGLRAVAGCCVGAAVAVALDAYFSAQEGYLARPAEYDGVGYLVDAQTPYRLIHGLHLKTAFVDLFTGISPLWVSVLTTQQLILGGGTWQAFSARFWAVALVLLLVYWIVRRRAPRWLAIVAAVLTALLPVVSAGVRASSWEFLSGQASFFDHWWLDDVRPDFFTIALALWSIAVLAEHCEAPRRSIYMMSAALAAAAVLAKTSTVPVVLTAWAVTLGLNWLLNRRSLGTTRDTVRAVALLTVLLIPWGVFGGGALTVVAYLKEIMAYQSAYALPGGVLAGLTYYPSLIPTELGQIEAWPVIAGVLIFAIGLWRRQLSRSELIYLILVPLFYLVFLLTPSKNSLVGEWLSLSIWIFFWAGFARVATARWPATLKRASPFAVGAVAAYTLVVYALGAFGLANWPSNERSSNQQMTAVTAEIAQELARHLSVGQCFTYLPGPGWPGSITLQLMDSNGRAPSFTAIDVDPTKTTVSDYVAAASKCGAVMVYREDIADAARVFFAPPVRQPYLRAVAEWVRSPDSGYTLDRTWRFIDLAPSGPHQLGHYQGVSLTLDLYLRVSGT